MKRILVPTDFSKYAKQAVEYAIYIANRYGSQITLLTTFETKRPTGSFLSMRSLLRQDAEKQMGDLLKIVRKKLLLGSTVEGRVVEGRTIDLIVKAAKYYSADLIIMGTKGASGLKEVFMGSKTSGVLMKTETPLLAVPNVHPYHPFNKIVLAIDAMEFSNPETFSPLLKIVKKYESKVNVFHLEKELVPAGFDTTVLSYLEGVPYEYHQSTEYDNINNSINDFVKETDADLLCMVRRSRGKLKEVFHSSVTKKEVFNSPVPLLILQDK